MIKPYKILHNQLVLGKDSNRFTWIITELDVDDYPVHSYYVELPVKYDDVLVGYKFYSIILN